MESKRGLSGKNLPSGGPKGYQTFPRGAYFKLKKPKKMRPRVAPWACLEKQWVRTCSSLTVVIPDFGG